MTDLLTEGTDKKLKPWLSTGKKVRRESLKTDGKKTVKGARPVPLFASESRLTLYTGSIDFEVEFFPCAHLKNISFTEPVSDAITEADEDEELEGSPATNGTGSPVSTSAESKKAKEVDPNEGIVIPREELIKTRAS